MIQKYNRPKISAFRKSAVRCLDHRDVTFKSCVIGSNISRLAPGSASAAAYIGGVFAGARFGGLSKAPPVPSERSSPNEDVPIGRVPEAGTLARRETMPC